MSELANGTGALFAYLGNYHRINLKQACQRSIHKGEEVGIWVHEKGKWRQFMGAEQRLKWSKYQDGQSACDFIISELFGLKRAQYEQIRASFEHADWQSWTGIYQANDATQKPQFVIVVKLPSTGGISRNVAGGVGAAAGLVLGAVLGTTATVSHVKSQRQSLMENAKRAALVPQSQGQHRTEAEIRAQLQTPLSDVPAQAEEIRKKLESLDLATQVEAWRHLNKTNEERLKELTERDKAWKELDKITDGKIKELDERFRNTQCAAMSAADAWKVRVALGKYKDVMQYELQPYLNSLINPADKANFARVTQEIGQIKDLSKKEEYEILASHRSEINPYVMFSYIQAQYDGSKWYLAHKDMVPDNLKPILMEFMSSSRRAVESFANTPEDQRTVLQDIENKVNKEVDKIMTSNHKTGALYKFADGIIDDFYAGILKAIIKKLKSKK